MSEPLPPSAGTAPAPGHAPRVRRLMLADFRSYAALDLAVDTRLVALAGENGAGKTNLLEALSLFTPGRGLRRADLAEMARLGGSGGFAASITLDGAYGGTRLGTGLDPPAPGAPASRKCRIDGVPVGSAAAFAEHLRLVWLTPALDGLFTGPPGDRRRFLDRLVLAVDAEHGGRVGAFERAVRSRNRLLEEGAPDRGWLDAVEREIAELGIAVAAARRETVTRLDALIAATRDDASPFPWASVELAGEIEDIVAALPAVEAEDRYRALLRDNRARDRAAGRTLIGPQASDLVVHHGPKTAAAARCSTGEQKALLVGLVLAHARLVAAMSGIAPLVLLDEIAAHLDRRRRAALFVALDKLGSQVWMTGADAQLFADLPASAMTLHVTPGRVEPFVQGPFVQG
ncbi:DNA replication/repair protein RecF [Chelatococcus sp. SYSU_G07232]|uniref:DNA replication and repair protein RecF n=1 Tax=Chelatococcus albus TaxID=3047466 RepID=A0ABT7AHM6_9HYPH|nr:DNA replication/repair protein RecF [Chelatococcus sp. SYSU_G07232]MDJ1158858.1 DNA replication/repair protein RecF [Chelatococcus sp. SYSU_G07232]